jgi:hypothetical protein
MLMILGVVCVSVWGGMVEERGLVQVIDFYLRD